MLNITKSATLHQIVCEIKINFKDITKGIKMQMILAKVSRHVWVNS